MQVVLFNQYLDTTGVPTTIEYHKLILEIEVSKEKKNTLNMFPIPLNLKASLSSCYIFQDFKNGIVDTAFIPKHEKELAEVSLNWCSL